MKDIKIQPLQDFVMLEAVKVEEVTRGGIVIPDSAQKKPAEGIIVAKAADASDEIALGDRVIYKEYSGTEIKLEGETYLLVPSGDLLAKYVEADQIPE
ncbi:MAG: co-chaperone GroES [Candidatus Fermentibacteria bacterium]|nr:co-chaperone GroES [Candidatus Fermentibacteria bacterium]